MKDDFIMRLKELRNKKHLTIRQAAKEFGVSHVSYLRWEQGIYEPNMETLCKICAFFNVSADYLIGIKE